MARNFVGEAVEPGDRTRPATDKVQCDPCDNEAADDQNDNLYDVGERDGLQPAIEGIEHRKGGKPAHGKEDICAGEAFDGETTEPEDGCEVYSCVE